MIRRMGLQRKRLLTPAPRRARVNLDSRFLERPDEQIALPPVSGTQHRLFDLHRTFRIFMLEYHSPHYLDISFISQHGKLQLVLKSGVK